MVGRVVAEVAEVGALGGDWVGRGPVHPDPHPHCHSDSNSKKAEITLTRGVDAKCNYLREVRRSGRKVHVRGHGGLGKSWKKKISFR